MTCPQDKPDLPEGAASNEPQPVPPKKRRGCWVVVAVAAVLMVLMALPALQHPHKKSYYIACANNLKMIGQVSLIYAEDFQGCFPPDLRALRDLGYITYPGFYQCPMSSKRPKSKSSFFTNYVYIGAGLQKGSTPGDIPIAMDDPRNYDRHITILFKDGHVHGFRLPKKMTSCVEVLHHLFPDLDQSPEGRLVLENAKKADDAGAAR